MDAVVEVEVEVDVGVQVEVEVEVEVDVGVEVDVEVEGEAEIDVEVEVELKVEVEVEIKVEVDVEVDVEVEVEVEGEVEIDVEKEVEGQVGIELKVEVEVEREVQVEVEVEDSQVHKRDDSQVHKRDDSQVHKRVPGPCPTNLFYLQTQMMLCERPFSCTCSLRWCYANEFSLKYVDSDQKQQTVRVTSRFDTRQWFIGLVYSRKPGDWNVHLCALHGLCQRHNSPQPGICRYNLAHWKRAQLGNGKNSRSPVMFF